MAKNGNKMDEHLNISTSKIQLNHLIFRDLTMAKNRAKKETAPDIILCSI